MRPSEFHYSYGPSALDKGSRHLTDTRSFVASSDAFTRTVGPVGREIPPWAQDFFTIGKAIHLADRHSRRNAAHDRWTRTIRLRIAIQDSDPWNDTLVTRLRDLAALLTGDKWEILVTGGGRPDSPSKALFESDLADEVALFSGGLDSTAYAAERANDPDRRVAFVSYSHNKLVARQRAVFAALWPGRSLVTVQNAVHGRDTSNRSRGLLFLATAVRVAATHGARSVVVPENGQLAINPPMTASRLASCSTRSVHPRTLSLVNQIIAGAGGNVSVSNPYLRYTKGEVCRRAQDAEASVDTLCETVSCGHPPSLRRGHSSAHCGRCFPCLVRRSALHAALPHDRTNYETVNFWEGMHDDVHALHQWLSHAFTRYDLISDVPLPDECNSQEILETLIRGRSELVALYRDLVPRGHPLHLEHAA